MLCSLFFYYCHFHWLFGYKLWFGWIRNKNIKVRVRDMTLCWLCVDCIGNGGSAGGRYLRLWEWRALSQRSWSPHSFILVRKGHLYNIYKEQPAKRIENKFIRVYVQAKTVNFEIRLILNCQYSSSRLNPLQSIFHALSSRAHEAIKFINPGVELKIEEMKTCLTPWLL